jgi:hypothetical protein
LPYRGKDTEISLYFYKKYKKSFSRPPKPAQVWAFTDFYCIFASYSASALLKAADIEIKTDKI